MRCTRYFLFGLQLIASSLMLTGCASWSDWGKAKDYVTWPMSRFAKDYQNPQRLAVIWSPDVMTMPGKPAARGFGGRIYFYNEKSVPVPVKGELIVYGYEETAAGNQAEKKSSPDKKFKFEKEQFAERFSKSDLGASYSVWIPWDDAGGPIKRITLIPIFKMEDGNLVHGDAAELTLPGKTPGPVMATSQSYPAVGVALNSGNSSSPLGTPQRQIAPSNNYNGTLQTQVISNAGQPIQPFAPTGQPMMTPPASQPNYSPQYPVQSSNYAAPNSYPNQVNTAYSAMPLQAQNNSSVYANAYMQPMGAAGLNAGQGMLPEQAIQATHQGMAMQNQVRQQVGVSPLPASGLKTTTIQVPGQVANRLADSAGTVAGLPQPAYASQPMMSNGMGNAVMGMSPRGTAPNVGMANAVMGQQLGSTLPNNSMQPNIPSMSMAPFTGQTVAAPMTMTSSGYPATPSQLRAMALRGSTEVPAGIAKMPANVRTQGSNAMPENPALPVNAGMTYQYGNVSANSFPQMQVANPIGANIPGESLPTQVVNSPAPGMPMIQQPTGSQPQLQSLPADFGPRKRQARAR
jgi:hypothetical protein